jgi:arsenate reductase (thioredoxin)
MPSWCTFYALATVSSSRSSCSSDSGIRERNAPFSQRCAGAIFVSLCSSRFEAFSAGISPKGQVSPINLKVLQEKFRIEASGARSKSWEVFKDQDLDFIVSVSEQAEQTSHAFPGQPILAHWPYDDPTKVQGTSEQVEATYFRTASRIRYRLQLFNNLSFDQLDRLRIEVR